MSPPFNPDKHQAQLEQICDYLMNSDMHQNSSNQPQATQMPTTLYAEPQTKTINTHVSGIDDAYQNNTDTDRALRSLKHTQNPTRPTIRNSDSKESNPFLMAATIAFGTRILIELLPFRITHWLIFLVGFFLPLVGVIVVYHALPDFKERKTLFYTVASAVAAFAAAGFIPWVLRLIK
jgi:hypothetical protein